MQSKQRNLRRKYSLFVMEKVHQARTSWRCSRCYILTGGKCILEDHGYLIEPIVLSGATDEMLPMIEETFGPAAYVFRKNINETFSIVVGLEYGVVGLNDGALSAA